MAILRIRERDFNVGGIIFDKDGTLIDFEKFWGPRTHAWVNAIALKRNFGPDFKQEMFAVLGYSEEKNQVRAESPLAVASMQAINILAAGVISRFGVPWHEARILAEDCAETTISSDDQMDEIFSMGDLVAVFGALKKAGIQIAVVTSDVRRMTERTLAVLGIDQLVDGMICGDDRLPNKPAPDAAWEIASQFNLELSQMMMVGDSLSDMQFAKNAGLGSRVGVAPTPKQGSLLLAHADMVISSLDEICLVPIHS